MENGVVNLVNSLDPTEFDLNVCCLVKAGAFADRLPKNKQPVVLDKPSGFSWQTVNQLREVFQRCGPTIVHTHNLGTLIYSVLAARGSSAWPILHGEHAEFRGDDLTLKRNIQRKFFFGLSHRVVPVSESLGQHLIEHGVAREKVFAINNGVDCERYIPGDRRAVRASLGLPENAIIIGMVGRFGQYKRHDLMVDAFEKLPSQESPIYLLLVGAGGPQEQPIKTKVMQSPAKDRIVLAGYQADPRAYYQAMDLLVIPSSKEGMSNAALEAMSTGVPVLCHTSCGNTDIIEADKNGFVCDMQAADQLARVIDNLVCKPERLHTVGLAGREYVLKHLSFQRMKQKYVELYQETARQFSLI